MKKLFLSFLCLTLSVLAGATDVSKYKNMIYVKDLTAKAGDVATLSICLKNNQNVPCIQFRFQLPDGVTPYSDLDTNVKFSSERTFLSTENRLTCNYWNNTDLISILAFNDKNKFLAAGDGEVFTFKIKIDKDMAPGQYSIKFPFVLVVSQQAEGIQDVDEFESTITIEPDGPTDIASIKNGLYVDPCKVFTGKQAKLSLMMNNEIAPTGFQCDVVLPQGITPAVDEDGFYMIELGTERTTSKKTDYFNSVKQADGSIRIMCSSTRSYTFSGNEGEVATMLVNVAEDMEDGNYPVILRNIILSDANSQTYKMSYVMTELTVESYTLGDANGDEEINVGDFTAIANYIMGTASSNFVLKAADVNEDGEINVGDLTAIANLILYGSVVPNSGVQTRVKHIVDVPVLSANDCFIKRGDEFTVDVRLGEAAFSAFQFDMHLPSGLELNSVSFDGERNGDMFMSNMVDDTTLRILCASTIGDNFDTPVMHLTFKSTADFQDANVAVDNIVTSKDGVVAKAAAVSFGVFTDEVTAITNINGIVDDAVYDITGKMINLKNTVSKGVYIINGKKVIR